MIYFKTRKLAREFARKSDLYKVVDNGTTKDHRWGVRILKK